MRKLDEAFTKKLLKALEDERKRMTDKWFINPYIGHLEPLRQIDRIIDLVRSSMV